MNIMDHYPTKKRRLQLSIKTPTRAKSAIDDASQKVGSPKVISLPKKKHKRSPMGTDKSSNDDLEIHWDNNSPSPSQAMKPARRTGRTRKGVKKELSSLIKQIPKSRKSQDNNNDDHQTSSAFTTWMQQNLASCPRKENSLRQNVTRSAAKKSSKCDALVFSEKIKQFLNQVPTDNSNSTNSSASIRLSPCMVVTRSQRSQTNSPDYFSAGSSDSLLNFGDSDDSLIAGLDSVGPSKTPVRACRLKISNNKTPKLTRSTRKKTQRPVPSLNASVSKDTGSCKATSSRESAARKSLSQVEITKEEAPPPLSKTGDVLEGEKKNSDDFMDINFDESDEIDQILSTQPDILQTKLNAANEVKTEEDHMIDEDIEMKNSFFTKINPESETVPLGQNKIDRKKTSTPMPSKIKKTAAKTPDLLIGDDEDFDLDNVLATFDMAEGARCQSQETPTRLTADQRKLKTKCHTSPLPLNHVQRNKFDKANTFIPIKTKQGPFPTSNHQLYTNMETLTLHSPMYSKRPCANKTKLSTTQQDLQKSFVKSEMVTTACRKPFVPPKKHSLQQESSNDSSTTSSSTSSRLSMALEISAIEGKVACREVADASLSTQQGSAKEFNPFSSTQKCTMSEIEEKRKYAQLKLRERLRRKRK